MACDLNFGTIDEFGAINGCNYSCCRQLFDRLFDLEISPCFSKLILKIDNTMFVGHFASALIPYATEKRAPLWLFLLAGISLDAVLMILSLLGIERLSPAGLDKLYDLTLYEIDMTYSHDLLPVIGWVLLFGAIVWLFYRNIGWALWSSGLVLLHAVCDFFSGYEHYIFGEASPVYGLGLYRSNIVTALAIELIFSLAILIYFFFRRGGDYSTKRKIAIYAVILLPTFYFLLRNILQ